MPARPWWPGQDQEAEVDLFAPRGLTNGPKEEHWRLANEQLPMPAIRPAPLPGMKSPDHAVLDQHIRRVRQRAWELANSDQVVNTISSIKVPRRG